MEISDLLKLPPAVMGAFLVMIWPAIWAAVSLIVSCAGDERQHKRQKASRAPRKAA
jgi:hypothetical protein